MNHNSMIATAQLLKEDFVSLLMALPDAFFRLTEAEKEQVWLQIQHALLRGETDPERLASLIDPLEVSVAGGKLP